MAKLIFSDDEIIWMQNEYIFPLKNRIIHSITLYFGDFANRYAGGRGHISKGERHLGQPWAVLDLPRINKNEPVNIFRIMFWWGRGWMISRICPAEQYHRHLIKEPGIIFHRENIYLGLGDDVWDNRLEGESYKNFFSEADVTGRVSKNQFLRISKILSIDRFNEPENEFLEFIKAFDPIF